MHSQNQPQPAFVIPLTLTPESSMLRGYGYDATSQTLAVEFVSDHDKVTHLYVNVPPATASGLDAAKSKGSYVARMVRTHFEHRRQEKPGKEVAPA